MKVLQKVVISLGKVVGVVQLGDEKGVRGHVLRGGYMFWCHGEEQNYKEARDVPFRSGWIVRVG